MSAYTRAICDTNNCCSLIDSLYTSKYCIVVIIFKKRKSMWILPRYSPLSLEAKSKQGHYAIFASAKGTLRQVELTELLAVLSKGWNRDFSLTWYSSMGFRDLSTNVKRQMLPSFPDIMEKYQSQIVNPLHFSWMKSFKWKLKIGAWWK